MMQKYGSAIIVSVVGLAGLAAILAAPIFGVMWPILGWSLGVLSLGVWANFRARNRKL